MGHRADCHCCIGRTTLHRLHRQKDTVQETSQGQRPQKGHERGDGRQRRSDAGGIVNEGTIAPIRFSALPRHAQ